MRTHQSKALYLAAGCTFVAATVGALLVGERIVAAGWQAFKFSGEGAIYLSASTGRVFAVCACGVAVAAAWIRRSAAAHGDVSAARWARAAFVVVVGAGVAYVLLGLSPWNEWRA
jgi:hypothetical protein